MADDIVTRLKQQSDVVVLLHGSPEGPEDDLLPADTLWFTCLDAVDEIESLRIAGDALALAYRNMGGLDVAHDGPLRAWEVVRRG